MNSPDTPNRCRIVLIAPAAAEAGRILSALDGGDVASLILPPWSLDEASFQSLAESVVPRAQEHGVAVMIAGDARVAMRSGADGLHIEESNASLRDTISRHQGKLMIGAGGATTRDQALELGELRPDYIFFGRFGYDTKPEPHPRNMKLGQWWAEMVSIPCVVMAGADPAGTVRQANAVLDEHGPQFQDRPMRLTRLALIGFCIALPSQVAAQESVPDGGRITGPLLEKIDPGRFSENPADTAYGAFQRGYYLTALNLATPLALAGNAASQTLIAEIYSRGMGVRTDLAKATEWYEKAANQGDVEAQFRLAMILIDGGAEFGDHRRAGELLRMAADSGHHMAQFNYAQWLIDDRPGASGIADAIDYYEKAAQGGLADGQYAMAEIYRTGIAEKPRDLGIARTWLERAARQNHDTAQIDLGAFLIEGLGGERDLKAGFGWTMRAARAGNVAAQNRVALLYRAGIGVEPDSIAAASWYMRARQAGLVDPVMEDHLAGLTDEQLELAARQARVL